MKKSLLTTLVIWIGAGCGYYFLLHGRYESPADWVTALVGGTTTMLGIGCFRSLLLAYQDKRLLQGSRQARLPNTKKMVAVTGRIISLGAPLKTPFSEQDAVLYTYYVYDEYYETVRDSNNVSRQERRTNIVMTGHELTPCAIQSNYGNVKLLSYPSLEGFSEECVDSNNNVIEKARGFISRTKYEDITGMKIGKVFNEAKDLFTDSDGTVSKHLMMNKTYDLETLNFKEQIVRNGEEVCVVGCYEPQKQGIIPDFSAGNGICRLYRGNQKEALKKISGKMLGLAISSIFLLGVVNAVIYFVLDRYDRADSQIAKRTERLINAMTSEEIEKVRELSKYSIDVNKIDSIGQSPLMMARDAETAKILITKGAKLEPKDSNGRNALMIAAQYGRNDVIEELLKAGANPNAKDNYNDTALSFARENNNDAAVEALLKAGALDERLSETTATKIGIESAPVQVCLKYIAAIHKEDKETMKSLCTTKTGDFFDTIRFDIWQSTRPVNPRLVQAFQKVDKASVDIDGEPGTYRLEYQLIKENGSWKIEREKVRE